MEFTHKPPIWNAQGVEPTADLQANGFKAGYKPPAPYFNYLFYKYMECLKELQTVANTLEKKESDDIKAVNDSIKNVLADHKNDIDNIFNTFTPTIKASGESNVINGSAALPFVNMKLFGKTEQLTTTGKNFLQNNAATGTSNGITFTINKNKSVTVSGTSTDRAQKHLCDISLEAGTYIFSQGAVSNGLACLFATYTLDGTTKYLDFYSSSAGSVEFTLTASTTIKVYVDVREAGITVSNMTLFPMIRLASITDPTYEPYTALQPSPSPNYPQELESKGKWGNLLTDLNGSRVGGTVNGVTFTINKDKSISVKGTATALAEWQFEIDKTKLEPNKEYILSGSPSGASDNKFFHCLIETTSYGVTKEYGNGITFNYPTIPKNIYYRINVSSGQTIDVTFYPMISKESISYRPYSGQMEIESVIDSGNLLDYETWKSVVIAHGTGVFRDNGIVLTSDANGDCYTAWDASYPPIVKVPCMVGKKYILSWEHSGADGTVYIFPNGKTADLVAIHASNLSLEYIPKDGVSFFTFRFGVHGANATATYKNIRINVNEVLPWSEYKQPQSHISLVTETGLKGIEVTDASLATYTDENGHMICADYTYYAKGVNVWWNDTRVYDGSDDENWVVGEVNGVMYAHTLIEHGNVSQYSRELLCTHYPRSTVSRYQLMVDKTCSVGFNTFSTNTLFIIRDDERITSLEDWKAWLAENPITLTFRRSTPIEKPLSASELASYKALKSNYKVTSVMNDCGAFMEVEAYAEMYGDALEMPLNRIASIEKTMSNIEAQLAELTAATLALSQE